MADFTDPGLDCVTADVLKFVIAFCVTLNLAKVKQHLTDLNRMQYNNKI